MVAATRMLTYEDYICSPEEMRRYDILDGEKLYMTNPTMQHQNILFNIADIFKQFQRRHKDGRMFIAPCDVLISRRPLRTRQPDVLFVSNERFGSRSIDDPAPLTPAPELVVEILSPSDTGGALAGKLSDYQSVNVLECWVVSPRERTVEILKLTDSGFETVGIFSDGMSVQSSIFPELIASIQDIFEI